MSNYTEIIQGHTLEYFDDEHQYIVDGICVPSITQILAVKFGHKYDYVNPEKLKKSAEYGTAVHKAIEEYCLNGTESDLIELKNFKFLEEKYKFEVTENETPVILFKDDKPIAAGRLDLVMIYNDKLTGADIKCTSSLDREYVAYQLNLYRIAYKQCYGEEWQRLRAIRLKGQTGRSFVNLPINENSAWELVEEYERQLQKSR